MSSQSKLAADHDLQCDHDKDCLLSESHNTKCVQNILEQNVTAKIALAQSFFSSVYTVEQDSL